MQGSLASDTAPVETDGGRGGGADSASGAADEWRRKAVRSLRVGIGLIVVVGLLVGLAPWLAPHDPLAIQTGQRALLPFSEGHLLGTDALGRDVLSRLLHGGRISLAVALVPTAVALLLGGVTGIFAGAVGGVVDNVVMRVLDVQFAFPSVLLGLGIAAALGPSMVSVMVAIVVVNIPIFGRMVRASTLEVMAEQYIEAARCVGVSWFRLIARHVVPNAWGPILVYSTLQTGRNVILAASLSFLGLGAQPPTPDWGLMLSEGQRVMAVAPHVATIPGLAIVAITIGFNILGDGMRDLLDPRRRTT